MILYLDKSLFYINFSKYKLAPQNRIFLSLWFYNIANKFFSLNNFSKLLTLEFSIDNFS